MPELLYSDVVEVDERVVLKQANCQLNRQCSVEAGVTGEEVGVLSFFFTFLVSFSDYYFVIILIISTYYYFCPSA